MLLKVLNIFLIRYNFFIAFCSISSLFYFSIVTEIEISAFYYLFTFFGTLALYNLFRLSSSILEFFTEKSFSFSKQLIYVSLIICGISFILIPSQTKLYYFIPLFLSFLYQFTFLGSKNLRSFPYLKIVVTAVVWLLMSVIPFLSLELMVEKINELYFLSISQFLFFLSLAIPFDVFDAENDEINTLAKILGAKKSIYLAMLFLFGYFSVNLLTNSVLEIKIAHGLITLIGFISLKNFRKMKTVTSQYYFIDGLILLQAGVFLFFRFLR
jgi:hypothetical protein